MTTFLITAMFFELGQRAIAKEMAATVAASSTKSLSHEVWGVVDIASK